MTQTQGSERITYVYDDKGQITKIINPDGTEHIFP